MNQIQKLAALVLLVAFSACTKENFSTFSPTPTPASTALTKKSKQERVVVANRASGDISVVDAATDMLIGTYALPDNGEPMYAVHVPQAKAVFVGDRANDRVVAFDEADFSVIGTVPCGAGVFHMWAAPNGSQLWVNNDIDNTTTIINPASMQVKGTAATPADLVALGGKPHDVFLDPDKKFAYVSVLGVMGDHDYVVKYNMNKFEEVGRVAVGQDPHLFADDINNKLYVPCQNTNNIYVIDRTTLAVENILPFAGAHGLFMPNSGDYLYVADIAGNRLGTFDIATEMALGMPLTTPFMTPHNLTINDAEDKLFVSHSGATADQLTIYELGPEPIFSTALTIGANPFGILYYSY
ncbi:MAG: YncE family protein [Phaeodactylibacter sp.]|nr:YncE family protein [Phaeodactylibacter sp.]